MTKLNGHEGVTDIAIDPRNPERVYAATWQHQRSVASLMDGGAKSAIYRREVGGETKLSGVCCQGTMPGFAPSLRAAIQRWQSRAVEVDEAFACCLA